MASPTCRVKMRRNSLGHVCTWQSLKLKLSMLFLFSQKVESLWSRSRRRSFGFLWQPAPAIPSFWWQTVRGQHVKFLEQSSIAELNLVCIQRWGQQEWRAMDRPKELCSLWGSWPIVFGFAEAKAGAKIRGGSHVYPWSFRHAAWLMTRFRVIAGRISYKMMFDREYKGKVVLFGESVRYKDVTALKGEAVYKRGVLVGKSFWSDSHIVLTPKGAVESRRIRRLTTQFSADDLVVAKGLPWSFSPQGILMKMKAPTTRRAEGIEEAEDNIEEKARQAGAAVSVVDWAHQSLWLFHKHLPLHQEHQPIRGPISFIIPWWRWSCEGRCTRRSRRRNCEEAWRGGARSKSKEGKDIGRWSWRGGWDRRLGEEER